MKSFLPNTVFLLALLLALPAAGRTAGDVVDSLLESDIFRTSQVALKVYDLTVDSTLVEYRPEQLMRPASTMKLLMTIAFLDALPKVKGFRTEAFLYKEANARHPRLYVKGGMDPRLSERHLRALVDSLAAWHRDTLEGVSLDLTFKDKDRLGEGWCWDDDNPVLSPLLFEGKDNFAGVLKSELKKSGIHLLEDDIQEQKTPRQATPLCLMETPLEDVLRPMMKRSDNLYAESLFYLMGSKSQPQRTATQKTSRRPVERLTERLSMRPKDYYIADGSGLSLYNYVSPYMEVEFLKYAYKDKGIYERLLPLLPIAGRDGTLRSRMRNTPAEDNVRAKTGTVTGVSALAGYMTLRNGHLACFSIINMGIRHAKTGRDFQDRLLVELVR